jgi:uncharacterized protein YbbK (DUF523 family)
MMNSEISSAKVIISACLLGIECNYKSKAASVYGQEFFRIVEAARKMGIIFIPVCPEQLGGLPTPRIPAELQAGSLDVLNGKGKIINKEALDVTSNFVKGARETLKIAEITGADFAVLKSNSPSCGSGYVYDGTFSGRLVKGSGVTAEILRSQGMKIFDENSFKTCVIDCSV